MWVWEREETANGKPSRFPPRGVRCDSKPAGPNLREAFGGRAIAQEPLRRQTSGEDATDSRWVGGESGDHPLLKGLSFGVCKFQALSLV